MDFLQLPSLQTDNEAQVVAAVGALLDLPANRPVAALYVDPKGCYVGVAGVEALAPDFAGDARL